MLGDTLVQPQTLYWNGVETKHHGVQVVRYAKNGPAKYVPSKAFDKYGLK